MDVVMPGLRGPELYQAILALQPRIRLLFISGYGEGLPETVRRFCKALFICGTSGVSALVAVRQIGANESSSAPH
jgi:hypothetical protein